MNKKTPKAMPSGYLFFAHNFIEEMKFKVEEIIENEDGSCAILFELSEEFKNKFIKLMELDEWNDDIFATFVYDSLHKLAEQKRKEMEK